MIKSSTIYIIKTLFDNDLIYIKENCCSLSHSTLSVYLKNGDYYLFTDTFTIKQIDFLKNTISNFSLL